MQTEMIRVFDRDFRYIGVCDDYSYLNYKRCFAEAGDFAMRVVFTRENYALYTACAYLVCPDGQCFGADAVYSDGEEITVKGRDVLALFDRAVLPTPRTFTGGAAEVLCGLAACGAEVLPIPLRQEYGEAGGAYTCDAAPGSLYAAMRQAAAVMGWGMGMRYDFDTGSLVFTPHPPRDRTAVQREREPLILGRERENLVEEYYASDDSRYRNGAIVVGESATGAPLTVTVPPPEGEDPRYLYRSAASLRISAYDTEAAYRAALYRLGESALALHRPQLTYTAVLEPGKEEDLAPGDRATVIALGGGRVFDAVIVSLETTYDRGDRIRRLVAGEMIPSLSGLFGREI